MRLGVVTDVHIAPPGARSGRWHNDYDVEGAPRRLERALDCHRRDGVDAIACLGDLVNAGDEPSLRRGLGYCAGARLPVLLVPGNHDCEERLDRLASSARAVSPSRSLSLPTPAGREVAGIRVCGLAMTATAGAGGWRVALPETAAWGPDITLLLCHFPVLSRAAAAAAAGLLYAGDLDNRAEVESLLQARPGPTVVIHGHLHIRDAAISGAVLQLGCAALVEPPYETALVTIEAVREEVIVSVEHTAVGPSPDVTLPVIAPPSGTWRYRHGAWSGPAG